MKRDKRIRVSERTLGIIREEHPNIMDTVALEELVKNYLRLKDQNKLIEEAFEDAVRRSRRFKNKSDKRDRIIAWMIVSAVATVLFALFAAFA